MATPKKREIVKKALQLFHQDNWQIGSNNPTESELAEAGYIQTAMSMLMRTNPYVCKVNSSEPLRETKKHEGVLFNVDEALDTGIFICGSSGSGKTYLAFTLADMLAKHGVVQYVFDPSQAWMNHSNMPNYVTVTQNVKFQINWRQSCIYDISRLTHPQRQEFVNHFCHALMQYRKNKHTKHPIFLWFEEAHTYFPNGCMRAKKQNDAVELVTLGRNYNIRFGAITQFPSMVDKLLVKMTKQRYFGWTSEKNDVKYIEAMIGDLAQGLRLLKTTQFVYDYPVRGGRTEEIAVPEYEQRQVVVSQPTYRPETRNQKPQTINFLMVLNIVFALAFIIGMLLAYKT